MKEAFLELVVGGETVRVPIVCSICKGALEELSPDEYPRPRSSAACRSAAPHPHIRCPKCSPPWFAACVREPVLS